MSEKNMPLLAAGIAIAVVLAAVGGYVAYRWLDDDDGPDGNGNPTIDRSISFPRDEGAHEEPFEQWLVQADLKTYDNQRFSLNVIFSHEDIVDQKEASLVPLSPAGERLLVFVQDGSMSCTEGGLDLTFSDEGVTDRFYSTGEFKYRLQVSVGTDAHGPVNFTLDLDDEKESPVLPFDEGMRKDYTIGSSYEYFQSRVAVFGQCNVSGYSGFIRGSAWIHHSWDYMNRYTEEIQCVQLKGGRDVWIYRMWEPSRQPYKTSIITVEEDGAYLQHEDAVLAMTYGRFSSNSDASKIAYPTAWLFDADEPGVSLTVMGSLEDQFMMSKWAGLSSASGTVNGTSVTGVSFSMVTTFFYANPSVTSVYATYLDDDLLPLRNFTVRATVTDSLPIDRVVLRYNVSRVAPSLPAYIETEMELGEDGFYYGAFSNPLYNWVVSFKVVVYDVIGVWGESERYDEYITWDTPDG